MTKLNLKTFKLSHLEANKHLRISIEPGTPDPVLDLFEKLNIAGLVNKILDTESPERGDSDTSDIITVLRYSALSYVIDEMGIDDDHNDECIEIAKGELEIKTVEFLNTLVEQYNADEDEAPLTRSIEALRSNFDDLFGL